MRAAVLSALLVPVFLTGCSTYVTVVSEPEGAVITDASGSIVYGRAPLDVCLLYTSQRTPFCGTQGSIRPNGLSQCEFGRFVPHRCH